MALHNELFYSSIMEEKMGGFAGSILYVDLGSGKIEKKPLDMDFAREYMGGLGFGTKIYLDLIKDKPDFDALSPDNPVVLMTGPLTGMKMNAVARWTVGAKSPLSGFWGDANVGGYFGAELKFAGYDGIVLTGASEKPCYLFIEDDKVEIRDAEKYWGMDVYESTDSISADLKGDAKAGQVLTIGPAGENKIVFASIINNKGHVAGRSGMGAVWGSKNLKAMYVKGSGKLAIADQDALKELKTELKDVYGESITIESLRSFGTASHMDVGIISGDIPIKNWQQTEWDDFDEIGPVAYGEKILKKAKTCYGCGVMCKREVEVEEGPFKMKKGPGPEYETVAAFGTMCLNPSIESIGKANEICNLYGMDTITCGSTVAFALECYEKEIITKDMAEGLDLTWGNSEAIVALTEKIGKREGIGEILSLGSAKAAEKLGGDAKDYLATVKGMEAPMHDHRSAHGYALAYAVSPRGACHMASLNYPIEGGGMFLPEFEEFEDDIMGMESEGKARINVIAQDFGMFFSSCSGFCNLGGMILNATQVLAAVNSVTGFNYTLDEVMKLGRRVWYLKRGISNIFGATAKDDQLPKRLRTVMESGPTEDSEPDMELMLREFYELRSFDENGLPTSQVLKELDLPVLDQLLHGS